MIGPGRRFADVASESEGVQQERCLDYVIHRQEIDKTRFGL